MAFYKKSKQKVNGKWYPRSVTVGKPVTTDEVADRLARISTVSRGDTYAVLKELGGVLGDCMADGRTVKLDGVGTFYYTSAANGQGVDTPEEVSAKQITGVRVRFIPETSRNSNNQVHREVRKTAEAKKKEARAAIRFKAGNVRREAD